MCFADGMNQWLMKCGVFASEMQIEYRRFQRDGLKYTARSGDRDEISARVRCNAQDRFPATYHNLTETSGP
jgi:hypothetical protein